MSKEFIYDLAERAAWTFVQTFIAVFGVAALGWLSGLIDTLAAGNVPVLDFTPLTAAAVAGVSAGIASVASLVKGLVASFFGNGTPATLPSSVEPVPNAVVAGEVVDEGETS